jgi:hypothetical protein
MAILATLRSTGMGQWPTLPDFLREARLHESGALGAMGAAALSATPEEQRELAESPDAGGVLLDLARDLRVPKAARLAAARCLIEAGIEGEPLAQLFIGAGDLVTDPRLGSAAKKLVEQGLPQALLGSEPLRVSFAAGAFARAVHAASSAVGQVRVREILDKAPPAHAGVSAALFAMGGELPVGEIPAWKKLLADTCVANRKAPAAARRMGLAPPWPPNLPDSFAPLVQEAEKAAAGVASVDAAANPSALLASAPVAELTAGRASGPPGRAAPPPLPGPRGTTEVIGQRRMEAPIKRSPFRKPIGTVVEGKTTVPPKPMAPVSPQHSPASPEPFTPAPERPRVQSEEERETMKAAPLPGLSALPSRKPDEVQFDPLGNRVPRKDRWNDDAFQWQEPVLPSSEMPRPLRAAVTQGPFAPRLQSLLDDRPEAVDRLCAAAEARVAVAGEEQLLRELTAELGRKKWEKATAPPAQLRRLESIRADGTQPDPWRKVAQFLIDRLTPRA